MTAAAVLLALPGQALAAADQPNWRYFPNVPALDGADDDRRVVGCFPAGASPAAPCTVDERNPPASATVAWDSGPSIPSFTTSGPNADAALSALSPLTPGPDRSVRPTSTTRDYFAPWTDQWRNSRCDPSVFAGPPVSTGGTDRNDVNAATYNLFAALNRMHDWSEALGFTPGAYNMEGDDPMLGDAQASARSAPHTFAGRDAANRTTPVDGTSPTTTTYLWQPIAGAYYPPCVDGSFDMSLIAHAYAHAIANRMVGDAATGLASTPDGQALAIGEGFADMAAVGYLHDLGYAPADDEDPFVVGAYVSGNGARGVRNFSMAASPLNYSNVQGYDGSGRSAPHDDGEIWAAAGYEIRQALVRKYPSDGHRRWLELIFDALPGIPPDASMVEARDAVLDAATVGDLPEIWSAFARRGLGAGAASEGTDDPDPVPSFESPASTDEATVRFAPAAEPGGPQPVTAELYAGDYEAGVTPVADTDPATPLDEVFRAVPGSYRFVARAPGYGAQRVSRTLTASENVTLAPALPLNRASAVNGAAISGDGARLADLIDDTEATNWEAAGQAGTAQTTVRLAGGRQLVESVNVSALVRGTDDGDERDDGDNQNRFTALRQFELHACISACDDGGAFTRFYASPPDAFPGAPPRPVTPELALRSFDVPDVPATHLRLVALSNQCTGLPLFNDNSLDNDPDRNSDCTLGNTGGVERVDTTVRAAELQVFSTPIVDPVHADTSDPAPRLSGMSVSPKRFRLGRRLPSSSALRTGTRIRFQLSEPARVTLRFRRATAGRRVGRRCLAPTRARSRRPRCRRHVVAGRLTVPGTAGANTLRFQGRLSRRRSLRPGSHRVTATAVDAVGQRSKTASSSFRLLPRRR